MVRLERLGPQHAEEILTGQDEALAREISGCFWDRARLEEFLERTMCWREDGPIREFAAVDAYGALLGGGGVNALAPEVSRGQAALTYWVLERHRGQGLGLQIAAGVVERMREWGPVPVPVPVPVPGRIREPKPGSVRVPGASGVRERAQGAVEGGDAAGPRSAGGVRELVLLIAPENLASAAVARGLGAVPTGEQGRHPADATRSIQRWVLAMK